MPKDESIRSIAPETLQEIVAGTSAEIGERFFDALVQHLSRAVDTKYAWVTEWLPDRRELHALSFWTGERFIEDYTYPAAGTPCERVIDERHLVYIPERVVELFPHDEILRKLDAVSYMGVPLLDTSGEVLGHLAVMDDKPMYGSDSASSVLDIFAGRAAAELLRLKSERTLRERENKLSRLFQGAMDAILEFDEDLRITNLNPAAEKGIGRSAFEANRKSVSEFLTPESSVNLRRLVDKLNSGPDTEPSVWIPSGIDVVSAGASFPAEATLSRYEAGGKTFYALVLRNILDRIRAEERVRSLTGEAEYLRNEIDAISSFDEIIGNSSALRRVLIDVAQVAEADSSVLITGETGTGKELIARAIHRRSPRAAGPLITVNCAAISANLQESEFFGHERGSFTGAAQRRNGRFKLADGGTIFLDEVGEMSLDLQAKLLRVLQEGEFEAVGSSRTVKVDVRVIAATNRDLAEMSRSGAFRSDLLYRLNVFPLRLPPLRERRDDIVMLAEAFAAKLAKKRNGIIAPLTETMKHRLINYDWPGNVRELQNVIERAFITSIDGRTLNLDRALPSEDTARASERTSISAGEETILRFSDLKNLERQNIERALAASDGRISGSGGAADLLGLHANTLTSRMKSLGIPKSPRSR
jgi:PAS domain S-box-containing protein